MEQQPMFLIRVYNTSNKALITCDRIHTVEYYKQSGDEVTTVTGNDILTHNFPTTYDYHMLGKDGNYSFDASVIGFIEVKKVVY